MSTEFWIQMIVYGVSFGTAVGAFTTRLKYIEDMYVEYDIIIHLV